jgi:NAD(P)-dependent dehydrogenase (short-subunit alcohol dehydrogenase family)
MKVLIVSIDSDIGNQIMVKHLQANDTVHGTSRHGRTRFNLHLFNTSQWPVFTDKYDRIYYTIAIGDGRNSRAEVMNINAFLSTDFLNYIAPNVAVGGQVVVLTSEMGSISRTRDLDSIPYRLSKAALNMGVACCAVRWPDIKWTLMQPGFVDTKMTRGVKNKPSKILTPAESAEGVINSSTNVTQQFCFIDYAGRPIPF